jgi:hypothetical protein
LVGARSGKVDLVWRFNEIMADIDSQKTIYLFLHGRMDLKEKAESALVAKGFSKEKITMASPSKVGEIDQIKIQEITKVEQVEPEGMIGLWKGVSQNDIESIPLV